MNGYGWIGGWTYEWMDELMHGWIMDEWMDLGMNG